MKRLRALLDFYLDNRIQIGGILILVGCAFSGIPVPLPSGGSITIPIYFWGLVVPAKILAGVGVLIGGIGAVTKWLKLGKSQSQKFAAAVKEAARSGRSITVPTPPGQPDIQIAPVRTFNHRPLP